MATRFFRVTAVVELVTVVVLPVNLATVRMQPVASLVGPTHGCAYLVIVVATWRNASAAIAVKLSALLPGIGGLLVLRQFTSSTDAPRR